MSEEEKQFSIYDLTMGETDKSELKLKICDSLYKLNKSSLIFEDIINDYNSLYSKYINIKLKAEKDKSLYEMQLRKLQEENMKSKNSKGVLVETKSKLDPKEKRLMGLTTENAALKTQNVLLDKRARELNEISQKLEKELITVKKEKKRIEIEHKKLLDKTGKMIMEIELLRKRLIELQGNTMNNNNNNELNKNPKQRRKSAYIPSKEKPKEFVENSYETENLEEKYGISKEFKIPSEMKFRQKIHSRVITSINFNNSGSSYITTGADYIVKVFDAAKDVETNIFSGFESAVSEACFDHTEQFVFAGSLDKTAKLYSLQDNRTVNTFNGHSSYINCVKSLNTRKRGITGSSDLTIREWDYNTYKEIRKLNCGNACHSLALAPNDSFILSGHLDGSIKMWAPNNNKQPESVFKSLHYETVLDIKMINNDSFISLGKDETLQLFDIRKEQSVFSLDSNIIPQYCESSIGVSYDKKFCAIASTKGSIYIINLDDGKIISSIDNEADGAIKGLCWRPFNSKIYAGDSNGCLTIWGSIMGK